LRGEGRDGCEKFLAPGVVVNSNGMPGAMNLEAYRQFGQMYLTAFPDVNATVEEQYVSGDVVVTRLTWTGTHTGPMMNIPPTGRSYYSTGIWIDHIRDGQIAQCYEIFDLMGLMQQLGLAPAMA
jgi:steroid delta-isomerase-like uncharacterized protein